MGTYSSQTWMAGGPNDPVNPGDPAFDPGVAQLPDGTMLVSYHNWHGIYAMQRLLNGALTVPVVAAYDGPGTAEATLNEQSGQILAAYNFRIVPGTHSIHVRQVLQPTVWSPPVVGGGPTGNGPSGSQIRATLAATGTGNSRLLLVWAKPTNPVGGTRSLWGAISTDGGDSWGAPFFIASREGVDIANPFVVRYQDRMWVYFAQVGDGASLGVVSSSDGGDTWSRPTDVDLPKGVYGVGRPVMEVQGNDLICFCNWVDGLGTWYLGTFQV
jgi:hypothetical protein